MEMAIKNNKKSLNMYVHKNILILGNELTMNTVRITVILDKIKGLHTWKIVNVLDQGKSMKNNL